MDPLAKYDHQQYTSGQTDSFARDPHCSLGEIDTEMQDLSCREKASGIIPSPMNSPSRTDLHTSPALRTLYATGMETPPATPIKADIGHRKTESGSSAISDLDLEGESERSSIARCAEATDVFDERDEEEEEDNQDVTVFPYWIIDYEIADKKSLLGSGLWSNVYRAIPCSPKVPPGGPPASSTTPLTPPVTPTKPSRPRFFNRPTAYAVKAPNSPTSISVLTSEARILTHLTKSSTPTTPIAPFYGQDPRTHALILKAYPTTLESWLTETLNLTPPPTRNKTLASAFPTIALSLLSGLAWLAENGVIHGDIKPANILLDISASGSITQAVYSDFSSSTLSHEPSHSPAPFGGGTWDFLDPVLLRRPAPGDSTPEPSHETDLWALAMTLLTAVLGASPYAFEDGNVLRKREYVKLGTPLQFLGCGELGAEGAQRLRGLEELLGCRLGRWFGAVLGKGRDGRRLRVREWTGELEDALQGAG